MWITSTKHKCHITWIILAYIDSNCTCFTFTCNLLILLNQLPTTTNLKPVNKLLVKIVVFWVMTPHRIVVSTDILEKYGASIIKADMPRFRSRLRYKGKLQKWWSWDPMWGSKERNPVLVTGKKWIKKNGHYKGVHLFIVKVEEEQWKRMDFSLLFQGTQPPTSPWLFLPSPFPVRPVLLASVLLAWPLAQTFI